MQGALAFGCGQCLPCRINRGRQWTWRQYLESLVHDGNSFITLTYDRSHIRGDWSLDPRHVQLWLKRVRKSVSPTPIRYFLVGEYGDGGRPHYHVSLFGLQPYSRIGNRLFADVVQDCWGLGFTSTYEFNEATAQYTCGYITKKLKDHTDGAVWNYPEFARMSLKPGIGEPAIKIMAESLGRSYQDWGTGDVPRSIRIGKRTIGLGRYLLSELRSHAGFTDQYIEEIKQNEAMDRSLDMLTLFQNSDGSLTFTEAHGKAIAQRLLQVEARYKIWKAKRRL